MFEDEKLRVKQYKQYDANNKVLDWYELLTSRKAKIIIAMILFLFMIVLEPTKEVMKCNKYYRCSVDRQYMGFLPVHKEFRLSKKSKMVTKVCYDWNFLNGGKYTRSRYKGYVKFIDSKGKTQNPFQYYVTNGRYESDVYRFLDKQEEKFNNYIENPKEEYVLRSAGDGLMMAVIVIFVLVVIYGRKLKKFYN